MSWWDHVEIGMSEYTRGETMLKSGWTQRERCEMYGESELANETNWPASREKGPSDITNSVDPDQPLYNIENSYT